MCASFKPQTPGFLGMCANQSTSHISKKSTAVVQQGIVASAGLYTTGISIYEPVPPESNSTRRKTEEEEVGKGLNC